EVKELFVGVVVLGKGFNAESDGLDVVVLAEGEDGLDLIGVGVRRDVFPEELDVVQTEGLSAFERGFEVEFAEGVALDAEGEATEGIALVVAAEELRQRGEAEGGGASGLEEMAAVHACVLLVK